MAQVRPPALGRSASTHGFESKLSQQLAQPHQTDLEHQLEPSHSPKSRSLSDASRPAPPQPSTGDLSRASKDDITIPALPATPRRSSVAHSSISLHLPSKPAVSPSLTNRAPLSPKLDPSHIYGSPGSVLPRRSRGLDFSRACTNLHHSTLAESSPDSSPIVGGRGMAIPQRRGSLGATSVPPFSTSGPGDRTTISSSMSSVNMMESDTSSSEEEDESMADRDDIMLNTPQATRISGPSPFASNMQSPGNEWMGGYSQAAASLMSFQRARFRKGRSRHSSSSASGNSSKHSPAPHSPPIMKSVEHSGGGYFAPRQTAQSRRESLSFGARDLRLSDMSDDGENRTTRGGSPIPTPHPEGGGPLGVIRRAVTRRGSLLPKTKTFARIRAALMEEGAPVDSDMKREAEVVRQVRDTEPESTPALGEFPSLQPSTSFEMTPSEDPAVKAGQDTASTDTFGKQASRNSGGVAFWNSFDERYRTPPPVRQEGPSSLADEDMFMDMTPSTTIGSVTTESFKHRSRSSTPHAPGMPSIGEICRKRRRDDDFDPNLFKRRAVSPSVSVQSSPVMTHSHNVPSDMGPNIWGPPPKPGLGAPFSERLSSETSNRSISHAGGGKRVGLQGMTEASDGFMNMSID